MLKRYLHIFFFILVSGVLSASLAQEISSVQEDFNPADHMPAQEEFIEEDYVSSFKLAELQKKLDGFLEELDDLQDSYSRPFKISKDQRLSKAYMKRLSDDVKSNERKLKSIDLRWNIFYQTEQSNLAADEDLMNMIEDLNTIKTSVEDSIESRKNIIQAIKDFNAAEKFLTEQDTVYKALGKKALELSLSSKTAPMLEKLKVKEQIIFSDIQNHYDKARQGATLFKISQQETDYLDLSYASLKNRSDKIQQMAYKPWIQRIKDYLLGIAAVAIIIMFVNMMISKLKAAKKMKENLKKYKDSLNQNNNNDIPII